MFGPSVAVPEVGEISSQSEELVLNQQSVAFELGMMDEDFAIWISGRSISGKTSG